MEMKNQFLAILVLLGCFVYNNAVATVKTKVEAKVKHVILIGFDGMSPAGLRGANTPTFDKLMNEGSSSMHVRSVLPTKSSPNWAAMLMGAGPEQTGITSNEWRKDKFVLPAVVEDQQNWFPTIFRVIKDQKPNAEIGAIWMLVLLKKLW